LGKLVLWDLQSGERLHTLDTFLASDESREAYIAYPALAFSPDGTIVASTTESLETEGSAEIHNGGVGLWRTDAAADPLRIEPTWLYVTSVDFSPDGRLLVVGTKDGFMAQGGRLIVLQAESGDELRTIDIPGEGVRDLAFSPDGKLIAVAGVAGRVGLWETAGWESLGGLDAPASAVAFAPDGRKIVLNDGSMWDVTTLEMIREVPSAGLHFFSPDGRLLASANTDLTLLDMSTSQEVWRLASGSDVAGAAFSPDGRILVAAMAEGVLNLWGVPSVP
jgi:WD40 repeat protein